MFVWVSGNPVRSWISHLILAFLLSRVVGPWAIGVFYTLREAYEVGTEILKGRESDWIDHIGDVISGVLGAGIGSLLW